MVVPNDTEGWCQMGRIPDGPNNKITAAEIDNRYRRWEIERMAAEEKRSHMRKIKIASDQQAMAELDAIREQVKVLGVGGYNDKIRNDLLRQAIESGQADVDVNVYR